MQPDKKKDNLTDVVEQVSSEPAEKPATVGDGQVVSGGEVVTLDHDKETEKEIEQVAKDIVDLVKKDRK